MKLKKFRLSVRHVVNREHGLASLEMVTSDGIQLIQVVARC